ncbi:hypothetical protein [Kutzneria albida]|uniref:Uncharacterized protein n=1 Tax=Kutzneria albida DSM 43870 TaxID=1449976 RepID=W5W1U5_9PSEU|nr:hypothetical protein [Kutzneria albida]AHH94526.1 hypothetical protein KALB_1153 [Kutzneria albida DSM 43870]
MPNRTSLIRRLAVLRSSYTGETDSSVLPAIASGAKELSVEDRAQVLRALAHNHAARLPGEPTLDPVAARIRHALLPDATSPCQRDLEAAVLLATGRAHAHLRQHVPEGAGVFRTVRPQTDGLILHLTPAALPVLLLELLPHTVQGGFTGVPGLRVRPHRRQVHLVQTHVPDTSVHIAAVSYRQWVAATAFVQQATGLPTHTYCSHAAALRPLDDHETSALAGPRAQVSPELAGLASSLLRRQRVCAGTTGAQVTALGDQALSVRWTGGHSPAVAAALFLLHPIMGLPGDRFVIQRIHENHVLIHLRQHAEDPGLVLELTRDTTRETRAAECHTAEEDLSAAWASWETALATASGASALAGGRPTTPRPAAPSRHQAAEAGAVS